MVRMEITDAWFVNSYKHDADNPYVRARLMEQAISTAGEESAYAATPPVEAQRVLPSQLATEQWRDGKKVKAFFC